jgi:hypothetical protein
VTAARALNVVATTRHHPEWLTRYFQRGFRVVYYDAKTKGPTEKGWTERPYTLDDYCEGQNVGVFLGHEIAPGRFLCDVDLDWADGLSMVRKMLPQTDFGFGRASQVISHAFYTTSAPAVSKAFDDIDGKPLVELRGAKADGAIGFQTMVPPSIHPTGEQVVLRQDGDIAHADEIGRRVLLYAIACILLKHLGHRGLLHDVRLALAGFLLQAGLAQEEVSLINEAVAEASGNNVSDVRTTVESTAARLRSGEKVTGHTAVAKAVGEDGAKVIKRIREWLGEAESADVVERVEALNQRYFIVDVGTDTVVGEEIACTDKARNWTEFRFRSFEAFRKKLIKEKPAIVGGKSKPIADVWLQHSAGKQYDQLAYAPQGSGIVIGATDLNGWRGFTVQPAPGEWPLTRDTLIKQVMCRDSEHLFEWVLDWMAALFQRPGQHAETAPVLIGQQGTGKNVVAEYVLGRTFDGRHARVTTHTKQVLGEFNDILSGLCLLVLDEVGLTTQAEYNGIKGLVTGHTLDVNRKHIHVSVERSMLHVMVLSNGEVPIKVAGDDRRFPFFHFASTHRNNTRFFATVARELDEQGGRAAMLHELLARDVDWDRLRLAPETEPKQDAKRKSWSDVQWFIYQRMRDCGPSRWTNHEDVRREAKDTLCQDYRMYLVQINSRRVVNDVRTELHQELKKLVPEGWDFNRVVKENGENSRKYWTLPHWPSFRASFEAAVGCSVQELEVDEGVAMGSM